MSHLQMLLHLQQQQEQQQQEQEKQQQQQQQVVADNVFLQELEDAIVRKVANDSNRDVARYGMCQLMCNLLVMVNEGCFGSDVNEEYYRVLIDVQDKYNTAGDKDDDDDDDDEIVKVGEPFNVAHVVHVGQDLDELAIMPITRNNKLKERNSNHHDISDPYDVRKNEDSCWSLNYFHDFCTIVKLPNNARFTLSRFLLDNLMETLSSENESGVRKVKGINVDEALKLINNLHFAIDKDVLLENAICASILRHKYDSRCRALLHLISRIYDISFAKVLVCENRILSMISNARHLKMTSTGLNRAQKKSSSNGDNGSYGGGSSGSSSGTKMLKIIAAAAVGGTALFFTGGLAAPAVVAGLGLLGIGSSAFAAAGGVTMLSSVFGISGAGLVGYKMKIRVSGLDVFQFVPLHLNDFVDEVKEISDYDWVKEHEKDQPMLSKSEKVIKHIYHVIPGIDVVDVISGALETAFHTIVPSNQTTENINNIINNNNNNINNNSNMIATIIRIYFGEEYELFECVERTSFNDILQMIQTMKLFPKLTREKTMSTDNESNDWYPMWKQKNGSNIKYKKNDKPFEIIQKWSASQQAKFSFSGGSKDNHFEFVQFNPSPNSTNDNGFNSIVNNILHPTIFSKKTSTKSNNNNNNVKNSGSGGDFFGGFFNTFSTGSNSNSNSNTNNNNNNNNNNSVESVSNTNNQQKEKEHGNQHQEEQQENYLGLAATIFVSGFIPAVVTGNDQNNNNNNRDNKKETSVEKTDEIDGCILVANQLAHGAVQANIRMLRNGALHGDIEATDELMNNQITTLLECIYLVWEPEIQNKIGKSVQMFIQDQIKQRVVEQVGTAVIGTIAFSTLTWPMAVLSIASLIDSTWSIALLRAKDAGKQLARVLMDHVQGYRPVTLFGYSVGAVVCFECLLELEANNRFGIVESCFLLGAPITIDIGEWKKARKVVAHRFVNCYCKNDFILKFVYRSSSLSISIAGIHPVILNPNMNPNPNQNQNSNQNQNQSQNDTRTSNTNSNMKKKAVDINEIFYSMTDFDVENVDVTKIVNGHDGYFENLLYLVHLLGVWNGKISEELIEIINSNDNSNNSNNNNSQSIKK